MTQSLSVWRSMPAHFAASARLMPSSALAIPNRRREMRASGSDLASLRSTVDVRSLRIFSFAIARLLGRIAPTMESELKADGNRRTATRVELYARRYDTTTPTPVVLWCQAQRVRHHLPTMPLPLFSLADLETAAALVRTVMPETPQYAWPLLASRTGAEVWVKHENHTPIGAFKLRGGLVYMDWLNRSRPRLSGVVTATRGNHGQSVALAGRRAGVPVTILVPRGNSAEKNAAMEGFGAELIVHGRDFDEAKARAVELARERSLYDLPSFDPLLVRGVATYALELFRSVTGLHTVYVPIGMGSGICGVIAVRDLLGLSTDIVGVVAAAAPAVALSVEAGHPVPTGSAA